MTLFHTCCETLYTVPAGGMKVNERRTVVGGGGLATVCPPNRGERSTRMGSAKPKHWALTVQAFGRSYMSLRLRLMKKKHVPHTVCGLVFLMLQRRWRRLNRLHVRFSLINCRVKLEWSQSSVRLFP